ncbi:MAG TPA: 3-deoxy-manno-octulosonate cytidylyltransferase [Porticoccaceae bacterium]|nr:3-deoxy-manno-octulosonate cytidylyltransferase [Porticoccaceae bacterium]
MAYIVVIPARYASSRLPGKPLRDIVGKTLVQRVYEQATHSGAQRVLVATDDERIEAEVKRFGGEVLMTRTDHVSGTDRLAEVVTQLGVADDEIVVNVQGDEPLIPPAVIDQVAVNLAAHPEAGVATLCEPVLALTTLRDPNVVKLVSDVEGRALYFSRAPIPWARDHFANDVQGLPETCGYRRHIGLYAYRAGLLRQFVSWPVAELERTEALEQLRFMYHGVVIHVDDAVAPVPPGVDTEADLAATIAIVKASAASSGGAI